jgi:GNAT superfamily N-acetyltransferase
VPSESINQSRLTDFVTLGMRVVLRFRLEARDIDPGGPTLTDALGEVISLDSSRIVVATRQGQVTVDRADVVAAKQAPPAPMRRASSAAAPAEDNVAGADLSTDTLQELMTSGMPPLESERLGAWLLRAADGYTGRANSVLPIGDSGLPLASAVEHVCRWYAERGIPPLLQLPHSIGVDPFASELGAVLAARGARPFLQTFIMTKATPDGPPTPRAMTVHGHDGVSGMRVVAASAPTPEWWAASSPRSLEHRETLARILELVPDGVYLTAYLGERPVGHARLAFTSGWSGIFDVHTDPTARRQGVARALMTAADAAAREARIPLQYLQVALENTPAVRLYDALGWRVHHEYHYARFDTPRD